MEYWVKPVLQAGCLSALVFLIFGADKAIIALFVLSLVFVQYEKEKIKKSEEEECSTEDQTIP